MLNNFDGQISAKGFYEFMKKVSEYSKSPDDFAKISFKLWDNSDRKAQNPSYPDYSISFKLGDGTTGAWNSVISIWKSKPKDNTLSNSNNLDELIGDNSDDLNNVDDESSDEKKIDPNDLPF